MLPDFETMQDLDTRALPPVSIAVNAGAYLRTRNDYIPALLQATQDSFTNAAQDETVDEGVCDLDFLYSIKSRMEELLFTAFSIPYTVTLYHRTQNNELVAASSFDAAIELHVDADTPSVAVH